MESALPTSYKKVVANKLSTDFREATNISTATLPASHALKKGNVIIRNIWAGVNASDVNWTAGRYVPGMKPPFDCGFESLAVVVAAGPSGQGNGKGLAPGTVVLSSTPGGFAEYQIVSAKSLFPVPTLNPAYLPLRVNGLTAYAALEERAKPRRGEVALVTAAAGGTGQFAVQLLKHHYGCTVIGTCSGGDKVRFLQSIGCDCIVDYKKEDLHTVLKKEYPNGVDVVFESIGGRMFEAALANLAVGGRLLVIGAIETYVEKSSAPSTSTAPGRPSKPGFGANRLNMLLISKHATVSGFLLTHLEPQKSAKYLSDLVGMLESKKITSVVDPTPFRGVENVASAVEYLHSGKSIGKVVVQLGDSSESAGGRHSKL
jgi:NADPH-dependent curcumin reductase CurA